MGHRDIKTTMLYLRFVEGHAEARFREAEKAELLELAGSGDKLTGFRSVELGRRDSNPDKQIQSLRSYRWTTSQG